VRRCLVCALLIFSACPRCMVASQTTAPAPARLRVDWQTETRFLLSGNKPVYPQIAAVAHIEGVIRVRTIVGADGSTKDFEFLSGPPLLMLAALNAVRTWRFKPTMADGVPVEVETVAQVEFFLGGDNPARFLAEDRTRVQKRPDDAKAHADLASGLLIVGQVDESVSEYRKATALRPNDAAFHFDLGNALRGAGDMTAAVAEYRQGLQIKPRDVNARADLASILDEAGDLDGAIREYRTALDADPLNFRIHYGLAGVLVKKEDFDGAIVEYRHAIREGFSTAEAHYRLGMALEKKGDLKGALKEYKDAASGSPQEQKYRDARDRLAQGAH